MRRRGTAATISVRGPPEAICVRNGQTSHPDPWSIFIRGEERRPSAPFARPRASKRRERLGALVCVAVPGPGPQAFPALNESDSSLPLPWGAEVNFPLNPLGIDHRPAAYPICWARWRPNVPCFDLIIYHTHGEEMDECGVRVIVYSIASVRARARSHGAASCPLIQFRVPSLQRTRVITNCIGDGKSPL